MRTNYTNPSIQRAFDLLDRLSADEITRRRAEMRKKALRNDVTMLESAKEEGRQEGREEGHEEGLKEGVMMGITAMLDVKFGADGLVLLPVIQENPFLRPSPRIE